MASNDRSAVTPDTVYSELCSENRRYRDYELTASTWYTVMLLGVLGFVVTVRFGDTSATPSQLTTALKTDRALQLIIAFVLTLVGGASVYSVRFANLRYLELREYIKGLQPKWHTFTPDDIALKPVHGIYFTHFMILVSTDAVLFSQWRWWGVVAALALVALMYLVIFRILLRTKPKPVAA